jgi:hypothetical protein
MVRAPLSFDQAALVGLEAVPHRLLREQASDDQIVTELLHVASQFPKRTKHQLELRGRGTPTIRRDLIAIAVGRQLRQHRLYVRRYGEPDHERHEEVARMLRRVGGSRRRPGRSHHPAARVAGRPATAAEHEPAAGSRLGTGVAGGQATTRGAPERVERPAALMP